MTGDGGFINPRTGKYVSSMRAHQHVGESIGGYEKAISKSTGNFYMRPTSSVGSFGISNPFLSMQVAALEAQVMQTYASMYVDAVNSAIESLNKMTRDMQIDSEESIIKKTYESALKNIASFETLESLDDDSGALSSIRSLIPEDQIELFQAAGSLDDLKRNCNLVLRVLSRGKSKLDSFYWKMDSYSASDDEKAKARESYYRLDSIRASRREAFKAMRKTGASKENRESAMTTFWQTVDAELAIIDESAWREKKFGEACLLAEYGALEQSAEMLEYLGDYPGAEDKLASVKKTIGELKNTEVYETAERMLREQKFQQAIDAFADLGGWRDSSERLADAKEKMQRWQSETYKLAIEQFDKGEYAKSRDAFSSLGNYLDSKRRLETATDFAKRAEKYEKAEEYLRKGDYAKARDQFRRIATFKDAEARSQACQELFDQQQQALYRDAKADFDAGRYSQCIPKLERLGSYSDASNYLSSAKRALRQEESLKLAKSRFKAGMFNEARNELKKQHMQGCVEATRMLDVVESILQLRSQNSELENACKTLEKKRSELKKKRSRAAKKKRPDVASQIALNESEKRVSELESNLAAAGFFAFGEKKRLREQIEIERGQQSKLKERIPKEQAQRDSAIAANLQSMQDEIDKIGKDIGAKRRTIESNVRTLKLKTSMY